MRPPLPIPFVLWTTRSRGPDGKSDGPTGAAPGVSADRAAGGSEGGVHGVAAVTASPPAAGVDAGHVADASSGALGDLAVTTVGGWGKGVAGRRDDGALSHGGGGSGRGGFLGFVADFFFPAVPVVA